MKFRQAIVSFTGFQQSDSYRSSFEDGYFDHVAHFQGRGIITYAPRTWKTNVKVLADQLRRQGVERVAMLSYSHGQAAATEFAKYAYSIGIYVDLWIACDPVYRPTWLPRWTVSQLLAFQALLKKGKIKIPDMISRTVYIRQEKDRPQGHTLVATGSWQVVELAGVYHSYGHTQIDGAEEWWDLVKKELSVWTNPPKAIPILEP
jgi:hypothetical protein